MSDSTTKRCTKCGQEFPATSEYFYKNNQQKSKLSCRCKQCGREDSANQRRKQGITKRETARHVGQNGFRKCTKCNREFPPTLEYFYTHKGHPNNLDLWCKECKIADSNRYAQIHAEEQRLKSRIYYQDHKEIIQTKRKLDYILKRPEYLARSRARYLVNKHDPSFIEQSRKSAKKSRDKRKDKIRISNHNWKQANKDKVRSYTRNRRAKQRAAEGFHTAEDVVMQYKSQNGKCWWCGKSVGNNYHVDHRIAIERGGSNWPANICISCPSCNTSKADKMPWEWSGRLL